MQKLSTKRVANQFLAHFRSKSCNLICRETPYLPTVLPETSFCVSNQIYHFLYEVTLKRFTATLRSIYAIHDETLRF
jgi:hypothetical protein